MTKPEFVLLEPRNTKKDDIYILIESAKTGEWYAYPVETDGEICRAEEILLLQGYTDPVTLPIYRPGPKGAPPETGPDPYTMEKTGEFITIHPRKSLFLIPR
jgi:hypothetical protein